MLKLKNKRLFSLILSGFITIATSAIHFAYANEGEEIIPPEVEETVPEEIKNISISEIKNTENLNLKVSTKGTVTKIEENKIYIKDDSAEGIVYLKDIVIENIKVDDTISIIGVITQLNEETVILVDSIDNVDNQGQDQTTPEEDKNETKPEVNKPQEVVKPEAQQKPTSATTSTSNKEEIVINSVKGKSYIIISTDLTEAQWDKVKEALENNLIKVKDIENNKIRITQVDKETGDTVWIVNDPRMLDKEEEETTTSIGSSLLETTDYTHYDVSENTWNSIVDDIVDGVAKIKLQNDHSLKIIYKKSDGKDSNIILEYLSDN